MIGIVFLVRVLVFVIGIFIFTRVFRLLTGLNRVFQAVCSNFPACYFRLIAIFVRFNPGRIFRLLSARSERQEGGSVECVFEWYEFRRLRRFLIRRIAFHGNRRPLLVRRLQVGNDRFIRRGLVLFACIVHVAQCRGRRR